MELVHLYISMHFHALPCISIHALPSPKRIAVFHVRAILSQRHYVYFLALLGEALADRAKKRLRPVKRFIQTFIRTCSVNLHIPSSSQDDRFFFSAHSIYVILHFEGIAKKNGRDNEKKFVGCGGKKFKDH